MSQTALLAALVVAVIGVAWRVAAFVHNQWPHGDVLIDAAIAESVAWNGRLLVPFVDVRFYPIDRFGFGYPLDQHTPLWPVLGAALVPLTGDGYVALRLLSLAAGASLPIACLFAFRPAIGSSAAALVAVLASTSYLLVDFAGNGSLWVLLALLYAAWVWLAGPTRRGAWRSVGLGVVMGLAFLANYPGAVLPIALVCLELLRWLTGRRADIRSTAIALAVAFLVISPWLTYSWQAFGNPIWSQPLERTFGAGGSRQVDYVIQGSEVVKRPLIEGRTLETRLRERAVDIYGNVGFVSRQLGVLGGLVTLLAGLACILWLRREFLAAHASPLAPVVVLAALHTALIILWPTAKFRYLVPLLPLVFALGAHAVWRYCPRPALVAIAVVGICISTNVATYLSLPSRTYYFNGGLVRDNFGGQGEAVWVDEAMRFHAAGRAITADGRGGAILADHLLYYFARQPLVVNSTAYPREVIDHLVRKHNVRYIVAPHRSAANYEFLRPTTIWSDEKFVALALPR